MKTKRPATQAARRLHKALAALAERGINGERDNAREKLKRLQERYDFTQETVASTDLFKGVFHRATYATPIGTVPDMDIANAVKWAIEGRTGIRCLFKGDEILAEATPGTAKTLQGITRTIADGFQRLWDTYYAAGGLRGDRNCFMLGLFEGMMQDERKPGDPLPSRGIAPRTKPRRKCQTAPPPALAIHPYTVAVKYGREIRFSVPVATVENELRNELRGEIQDKQ